MPTIAIVGAGPGLGLSIAKTFGAEGFDVALVARSAPNLAKLVGELGEQGVEAKGFEADVMDRKRLVAALAEAEAACGGIDVLEYSPSSPEPAPGAVGAPVLEVTVENMQPYVDFMLHGAIAAARAVLPGMIERGSGALFFTTGASSTAPVPAFGNFGPPAAALRNWALSLHPIAAKRGVYVGHVPIGVFIGQEGPDSEADTIAKVYWDMYLKGEEAEHPYGSMPQWLLEAESL
ncbi:MAG TPA: SDR family NAD(P)-dependent oxidoreductase [Solirubrobacterales bacterium]|jgi:NADP-dependent 3-hydroxy acid dehydrogenase YdfG|nr:SDR family NAD(P)-dependent oxidoreductase [Solirubrobacterales bacterium]